MGRVSLCYRPVHLIDFGLTKKYRDGEGRHIPYQEGKGLTGTARYASLNQHLGIEQARRDDLEAVGYILMYFYHGSLPWQGVERARIPGDKCKTKRYEKIMIRKMVTPVEEIGCQWRSPKEFITIIDYARGLRLCL